MLKYFARRKSEANFDRLGLEKRLPVRERVELLIKKQIAYLVQASELDEEFAQKLEILGVAGIRSIEYRCAWGIIVSILRKNQAEDTPIDTDRAILHLIDYAISSQKVTFESAYDLAKFVADLHNREEPQSKAIFDFGAELEQGSDKAYFVQIIAETKQN